MIICRKCQRHHPDNVGAGPCACGADLRRDGIALVQSVEPSPLDDSGLDELPPLGEELPALDNAPASRPPASPVPATPPPPPAPGLSTPPPPSTTEPAKAPPAAAPPPAGPPPAPAPGGAPDDSASALKGRRRRARSVKPQTPAQAPPPTPATPPAPAASPPLPPTTAPPPAAPVTPNPDVPQVVSADAVTPNAAPAAPAEPQAPEPSRRARSVNPRDLLAAREDADAPNVGDSPPPGTTGSGAAASPGSAATTEMEPTPPPPKAGERACPECFEANAENRRFCVNCGTTLPAIEDTDTGVTDGNEPEGAPKPSLRQRFKRGGRSRGAPGSGGGGRAKGMAQHQAKRQARRHIPEGMQHQAQVAGSWGQRAKAVGGRMKYGSGMSGKSKLKLAMVAVAMLVAVVALAGPGRGKVAALVGGGGPGGVSPAEAELFPSQATETAEGAEDAEDEEQTEDGERTEGSDTGEGQDDEATEADGENSEDGEDQAEGGIGEIAGFPASASVDEDSETGAGIPWELEDPQTGGLILTLEEPRRVRKILIAPGLPDSVEDGPLVLRPSRVRVCSDTGSCGEVTLSNSTSLQKHTLDLGEDVSSLILTVLEVHVPDYTTYDMAVIGEVRID